jgi:hypothetical protein
MINDSVTVFRVKLREIGKEIKDVNKNNNILYIHIRRISIPINISKPKYLNEN